MKRKWTIFMMGAAFIAATGIYWWQCRQLRTPTPQQLNAVFPHNTLRLLDHPDKFILYSLDPLLTKYLQEPDATDKHKRFHGYVILGQTLIKDRVLQERLKDLIVDGIADSLDPVLCFEPRHGIRVIKGPDTLDIQICFTCKGIVSFLNGKQLIDEGVHAVQFGSPYRVEFDRPLLAAGIPIAK
jgi:hypothetical protein